MDYVKSNPILRYVAGDATLPVGEGPRIIAHACNDLGAWGAGFSGALGRRYPIAEEVYRGAYYKRPPFNRDDFEFGLGMVQVVEVGDDLWAANMVCRHGLKGPKNPRPISYRWLEHCLVELARAVAVREASVHMPRIGCGLGGGEWSRVAGIIDRWLLSYGIDVTIYDLPG